MTFQAATNPNFPHPLYYGVLNVPYFVTTSVLSSVVLVAMRLRHTGDEWSPDHSWE